MRDERLPIDGNASDLLGEYMSEETKEAGKGRRVHAMGAAFVELAMLYVPGCGKKLSETLGRLKQNPRLTCRSCEAIVNIDANEFRKAEQSIKKLSTTSGRCSESADSSATT
jgi:hypothetical protein